MPLQARTNHYVGVNAHLNSILQNVAGEWESFHGAYIVDMTRALNALLPDNYEARNERSLQIRETAQSDIDDERTRKSKMRHPQPDVTIVQTSAARIPTAQVSGSFAVSELTTAVADTMDLAPEDYLRAAVIYKINEGDLLGRPVTRIELLSPTNKPSGSGYQQYRDKRDAALFSGMPLIEIDFLHQQPPVTHILPAYPAPHSHPYNIIVSDPRPSVQAGVSHFYLFDVDSPIPLIDIPLAVGEVLAHFDAGAVYNTTYANTRTYARIVDYEKEPMRFDTYSAADQQRIFARMAAVAQTFS